jgi:hypothetical protein
MDCAGTNHVWTSGPKGAIPYGMPCKCGAVAMEGVPKPSAVIYGKHLLKEGVVIEGMKVLDPKKLNA